MTNPQVDSGTVPWNGKDTLRSPTRDPERILVGILYTYVIIDCKLLVNDTLSVSGFTRILSKARGLLRYFVRGNTKYKISVSLSSSLFNLLNGLSLGPKEVSGREIVNTIGRVSSLSYF